MLDIKPIYLHEGELTSSNRLLERVCRNYPRAFEAVTGDGHYLNETTVGLLASHGKYAAAILKDETRTLCDEVIFLSKISSLLVYEEKKTTYRVWDNIIWDDIIKD